MSICSDCNWFSTRGEYCSKKHKKVSSQDNACDDDFWPIARPTPVDDVGLGNIWKGAEMMSCIRDVSNKDAFERELSHMRKAFETKSDDEIMRITWEFWSLKLQ